MPNTFRVILSYCTNTYEIPISNTKTHPQYTKFLYSNPCMLHHHQLNTIPKYQKHATPKVIEQQND